jgi:3-oxoacyl-[acyl-carrier protein] reductase
MKSQAFGRIILSTSTAAKEPIAHLTVSNAFRSGLLGLMKSLSRELASFGITVNSILPGYTHTKRLEGWGKSLEEIALHVPARRLGKPEECGALAAFLSSVQASYITGQAIACDGGFLSGL